MAGTSGLAASTAALVLAALNGGTAFTVTAPIKVKFLSAIRTANNGTDTEWATSGGYTAGGTTGPTWAAATTGAAGATQLSSSAVTITNAPAQTWAGCISVDAVPKDLFYAPVSPSKTVNAGDTVTVPSGQFTTTLG